MIQVKNAFRFISIRLATFSLNSTYTQMYKESNVANKKSESISFFPPPSSPNLIFESFSLFLFLI